MSRSTIQLAKSSHLCSDHFGSEMFLNYFEKRRLLPLAVPTKVQKEILTTECISSKETNNVSSESNNGSIDESKFLSCQVNEKEQSKRLLDDCDDTGVKNQKWLLNYCSAESTSEEESQSELLEKVKEEKVDFQPPVSTGKHEIEIEEENQSDPLRNIMEEENLYDLPEYIKEEEILCNQPGTIMEEENLDLHPAPTTKYEIDIGYIKEENSLHYHPKHIKGKQNICDQPKSIKEGDNICVHQVPRVEHEMEIGMEENTVRFIEEIEKRRALWDMYLNNHSNRSLKKEQWEEMVDLFGNDCCASNREKQILVLQKRWKNIRDCYSREKRRLKARGSDASRRTRQYIYYNKLLFLNSITPVNETETDISHKAAVSSRPSTPELPKDVEGRYSQLSHSSVKKRKNDDPIGKELVQVLKEAAIAREVRQMRKLKEKIETDDDKLFLLSLYSDFKKVPDYLKMQTKMEIMQVIQRAVSHQCGASDLQ